MQYNDDVKYYTLENDPDFTYHNSSIVDYIERIKKRYYRAFIQNFNMICISLSREYIYHNKGFIRFELKDANLETVNNALQEISNITINYMGGGTPIYTINLLLNLILMKEYGLEIKIIDVEQFINHYDVDSLIYKNDGQIDSKYIFKNKKGFYLDIPLLEEFYRYGKNTVTIKYHDNEYEICLQNSKSYEHLIGDVMIGFSTMIYKDDVYKDMRNDDNPHLVKNLILDTIFENFIIHNNNFITRMFISRCKFIFIVIYKQSHNIPNLININFSREQYKPKYIKHPMKSISLDNVIVYNFNDSIVYGISTNFNYDMHSWTQIKTEKIEDEPEFPHNHIDSLSLTFDNVIELNDMKIIYVKYNVQYSRGGMTGTNYNS
jgi:hypothetical protein